MISISNEDYSRVIRLLKTLVAPPQSGTKVSEAKRQAYLLLKKWNKKTKNRQWKTEQKTQSSR